VKDLLEHNADPNAAGRDGRTPLMHAVLNGEKEVVELLIAHKADLNARSNEAHNEGQTALHFVARLSKNRNLIGIAEILLNAGRT